MTPSSVYRRRIRITTEPGGARADLEDDPHRYGVIVTHDSARVLSITGLALRTPWTLCADAAAMLGDLAGFPVGTDFSRFYREIDGSVQCTHMADLAGLAIAHAGRGTPKRQYDFEVTWSETDARQFAAMDIDGARFLDWTVKGTHILSPEGYTGRDLKTMMREIDALARPDYTEAILLFRRAIFVSRGKALDLDGLANAAQTGHAIGACYVFRHGVAERALRNQGASLDFSDRREEMLKDLEGR